MKKFTIEINGISTSNKGAELMMAALSEQLNLMYSNIRLTVGQSFGDYTSRAKYGLYTTGVPGRPGRIAGFLTRTGLMNGTDSLKEYVGFTLPDEIDAVIDASGFAYSDKWPLRSDNYGLFKKMEKKELKYKPLIMMPQALGPFEKEETADAARRLFERAELVCARDRQSFDAVKGLGGNINVKQYPDMTVLVSPMEPPRKFTEKPFCAIVPNYRMLDKTGKGDEYKKFLHHAIQRLLEKEMNPVFLLHEYHQNDRNLMNEINADYSLPVFEHEDPRVLKGILGMATFVIGSRFHSLVSTFSQGVPAIGTSWSHKYEELFNEFDAMDLLATELDNLEKLDQLIDDLSNPEKREKWMKRISNAGDKVKDEASNMWDEIEGIINKKKSVQSGQIQNDFKIIE